MISSDDEKPEDQFEGEPKDEHNPEEEEPQENPGEDLDMWGATPRARYGAWGFRRVEWWHE